MTDPSSMSQPPAVPGPRPSRKDPLSGPGVTVLAGPTAVGKGTVSTYIRDHYPDVWLSVSATTRDARPGEEDGVHYFFVTADEFDDLVARDQMLEWAVVHGVNRYGTRRDRVQEAVAQGRHVLLEIDLQGARQVRESMPEATFVFLAPPSWDELVGRLTGRGTEEEAAVRARLAEAERELAAAGEFEARVVNADVREAARQLLDLMNTDFS